MSSDLETTAELSFQPLQRKCGTKFVDHLKKQLFKKDLAPRTESVNHLEQGGWGGREGIVFILDETVGTIGTSHSHWVLHK
jgi:hypothetical protein